MKSVKVNTESKEVKAEQVEQAEQAEQLSIETVDEVSLAIANSRFASLKSRELAVAGLALDENSAQAFSNVREKCKLYGLILKGELWKQDSDKFKNFKDCAEKLFHDKPALAYMQAKVGARFYSDDATAVATNLGNYLPYTTLDKLDCLKDSELQDNLDVIIKTDDDGKVVGVITQKDADELAKRIVAARNQATDSEGCESADGCNGGKAEVVRMYDFSGYRVEYVPKEGADEVLPMVHTIDRKNVPADALSDILNSEGKEHLFKFKTHSYRVSITEDGAIVVYEKREHVEPKAEATKPTMTDVKYDGIRTGRRNGIPAEVVAAMLGIDVDTVQRVYDAIGREEEVLKARAAKAGKSGE